MRVRHKVWVNIANDSDMKDKIYAPSEDLAEVIIDNMTKPIAHIMTVLAAATETVPLGDLATVKGAFLKVKGGDCHLTINGGAAIQLRRSGTATDSTAKFFIEADITAMQIIADGGVAVSVEYCLWGEPSS